MPREVVAGAERQCSKDYVLKYQFKADEKRNDPAYSSVPPAGQKEVHACALPQEISKLLQLVVKRGQPKVDQREVGHLVQQFVVLWCLQLCGFLRARPFVEEKDDSLVLRYELHSVWLTRRDFNMLRKKKIGVVKRVDISRYATEESKRRAKSLIDAISKA
jgi:hypothetical protein